MALPLPEPGLVISYSYLWFQENQEGNEDGVKVRPCVLVLASKNGRVLVTPIAHTKPLDRAMAVELPEATKRRLGLDEKPMWIICSELNEFIWPGPDLRPVSAKNPHKFHYGILPPRLFDQVVLKINFCARGRQQFKVVRSE